MPANSPELPVQGEKLMENEMRQPLLEPYMLGDLQLRNRVVMAPLTRTRAPRIRDTCPQT
jgi:2,4-dienoyl-CoA reductase-like NADH-dependent reductase (Old Yellow Enzyme family)